MYKRLITLCLVSSIAIGMWSESSSLLSLGLRGGGNTYMTTGNISPKLGGVGDLDLGYTCYWDNPNAEIGVHTGLSVGLCGNRFSAKTGGSFTNRDYLGYEMQYTVSATQVNLVVRQFQLEVPLMLALRTENMFLNVGAKLMMSLSSRYDQDMSDVVIDAYYVKPDVHVINRLITGNGSDLNISGKGCLPKYNILLGLEIGYEWEINSLHRIGLGFYADLSPWSSFQPSSSPYIMEVAPIDNPEYPPARVTIQPICCASTNIMLYCDFGLKFYYGINWKN